MTSVDGDPMSVSDDESQAPALRRHTGLLITLVGAVVVVLLLRAFVGQIFVIPSGSMEPTLNPGNRVLVAKLGYSAAKISFGDVVVFDGTGSFIPFSNPAPIEQVADWFGLAHSKRFFVKRVIGLPGDHVSCCTQQGYLIRNGVAIDERAYVGANRVSSSTKFSVVVPAGRLWLMGDNRPESADSRSHMGDPGGGFVPESRVVGRVVAVIWPPKAIRIIKPGVPQ